MKCFRGEKMCTRNSLPARIVVFVMFMVAICVILLIQLDGANGEEEHEEFDLGYQSGFGGQYWGSDYDYPYLYSSCRQGMTVFDCTDQANPEEIGFLHTNGTCIGVTLWGDYAYLSDEENGLVVADISDPSNPYIVSELDLDYARSVTFHGTHAYVAGGSFGFSILDITDPSNPTFISQCDTEGNAYEIAIQGNFAYIADWSNLVVVDILDVENPAVISSYPGQYTIGVGISGDTAYINNYLEGLIVVNVSDKENPELEGSYSDAYGWDIVHQGNYCYLAAETQGVVVLNVQDGANPYKAGSCKTQGTRVRGIEIWNDYGLALQWRHLPEILDNSNPSRPKDIGFLNTTIDTRDIIIQGNYGYIADGYNGFIIVDAHDINNLQHIYHQETTTNDLGAKDTNEIAFANDYLYVTSGDGGVKYYNMTDREVPGNRGSINPFSGGDVRDLTIVGNYLYAADLEKGIFVVNITDPENPIVMDTYSRSDRRADAIDVMDDFVYIAYDQDGLIVVNCSDKNDISYAGRYSNINSAHDLVIDGEMAYVIDYNSNLHILSISNRTEPELISKYYVPTYTSGSVTKYNDFLFITALGHVSIIDVSDPANPRSVSSDSGLVDAYRIKVLDDDFFLCDGDGGLVVLDFIPACRIENLSPNPVIFGNLVSFSGNGSGLYPITEYEWRSSIDGFLSHQQSFATNSLSIGRHTISMTVTDELGFMSHRATKTVIVHRDYPITLNVGGGGEGNFSTINEAFSYEDLINGDTIIVFEGMYIETLVIEKSIHLVGSGSPADSIVINGNEIGSVIRISADNVEIAGFKVIGSIKSGTVGGILIDANGCTIHGNILTDNQNGITIFDGTDNRIFDNDCHNNYIGIGAEDVKLPNYLDNNRCFENEWAGIELSRCANFTLTNNSCYLHPENGITLFYSTGTTVKKQ